MVAVIVGGYYFFNVHLKSSLQTGFTDPGAENSDISEMVDTTVVDDGTDPYAQNEERFLRNWGVILFDDVVCVPQIENLKKAKEQVAAVAEAEGSPNSISTQILNTGDRFLDNTPFNDQPEILRVILESGVECFIRNDQAYSLSEYMDWHSFKYSDEPFFSRLMEIRDQKQKLADDVLFAELIGPAFLERAINNPDERISSWAKSQQDRQYSDEVGLEPESSSEHGGLQDSESGSESE